MSPRTSSILTRWFTDTLAMITMSTGTCNTYIHGKAAAVPSILYCNPSAPSPCLWTYPSLICYLHCSFSAITLNHQSVPFHDPQHECCFVTASSIQSIAHSLIATGVERYPKDRSYVCISQPSCIRRPITLDIIRLFSICFFKSHHVMHAVSPSLAF